MLATREVREEREIKGERKLVVLFNIHGRPKKLYLNDRLNANFVYIPLGLCHACIRRKRNEKKRTDSSEDIKISHITKIKCVYNLAF